MHLKYFVKRDAGGFLCYVAQTSCTKGSYPQG